MRQRDVLIGTVAVFYSSEESVVFIGAHLSGRWSSEFCDISGVSAPGFNFDHSLKE